MTSTKKPVIQGVQHEVPSAEQGLAGEGLSQSGRFGVADDGYPLSYEVPGADVSSSRSATQYSGNFALADRDRVVIEFQRTLLDMTRDFLETQQRVMLAYLNGQHAPTQSRSLSRPYYFPADPDSRQPGPATVYDRDGYSTGAEHAPGLGPDGPARSGWSQTRGTRPMETGDRSRRQVADLESPAIADFRGADSPAGASAREKAGSNGSRDLVADHDVAGVSGVSRALEPSPGEALPAIPDESAGRQLSPEELVGELIEIVSQRTGYPPDMLDPQLDLEADLGIDSIKRVEILNGFRKLLPAGAQSGLEESIEKLAAVKTLQGIIDWIRTDLALLQSGSADQTITTEPVEAASSTAPGPAISIEHQPLDHSVSEPVLLTEPVAARGARLQGARLVRFSPESACFAVTIDRQRDLYLNDHTFDGIPVMPMAVVTELMLESAACLLPEWVPVALTDMEIPAGIVFESGAKDLLIVVQPQEGASGQQCSVRVSVVTEGNMQRTHFKARALMARDAAPRFNPPPGIPSTFTPSGFLEEVPVPPTSAEIYSNIMFHGKLFQGIKSVSSLGVNGITGTLAPARIGDFLAIPGDSDWLVNPALLDSAMQLAGVWARWYLDITCLPAGFASLRMLGPCRGDEFTGLVVISPETHGMELKCNLAVYSAAGDLVLVMEGLKGVGSKSLNRLASKPASPGRE